MCICVIDYTCCSNVVNSKVGRQTNRCEIVINKSNLTVGLSIPPCPEQRFFLISKLSKVCSFYNINIMLFLIAELIFTLVFRIFLKSQMVLSQLQLASLFILSWAFSYSLTNHRITVFVNLWLTPLKHQKVEKQQQQKNK